MTRVRLHEMFVAISVAGAAAIAGLLIPRVPLPLVIAGIAAALLVGAIALHPPLAAYLVIGITPLIAGIDRGSVIPFFRPSEAIAVLAAAGLVCRGVLRSREHGFAKPTLRRADISILLIAITSSVVPILWMLIRRAPVSHDDILYALVIWKFYAIYLIVRCSVHTVRQTRICLKVALVAAGIVAIISILQALQLFGVVQFLQHYYAPFGNEQALANNRGGSTLALPIAAADLFVFNIAIAFGLLVRGVTRAEGRFLVGISVLLCAGVLAAGEVSGVIALLIAGVALARLTGRGRYVVRMIPVLLVALYLLQPVLQSRLSAVNASSGVPVSWSGRLDNLRTFFWPRLFSGYNFVLGIRPSARVATTKYASGWVWIESGYTWLLWAGGIPLLLAFVYFVRENLRTNLPRARMRGDAVGAASLAVVVALIVVTACMLVDPHLTYRGSADLLFALLALASLPVAKASQHQPEEPDERALMGPPDHADLGLEAVHQVLHRDVGSAR